MRQRSAERVVERPRFCCLTLFRTLAFVRDWFAPRITVASSLGLIPPSIAAAATTSTSSSAASITRLV